MLSNCGHDENNRYSGGAAGDQTGTEYWLIPWYDGNWNEVLIHPDAKIRATIAEVATKAAQNDCIGYDQGERLTYYNCLKKVGWYPERIFTKCESDCSASSAAAVIAAGYRCGDKKLQAVSPSCVTQNIGAALVKAGFRRFTATRYLTSGSYLPKGTILNRSSGHVVVVVTDGNSAAATIKLLGTSSGSGNDAACVKKAQQWLIDNGYPCGAAGADGIYGQDTRKASVRFLQKTLNALGANLDVDGYAGKQTKLAYLSYGPVKRGCMSYSLTRTVQVALMLHGYSVGECGIDGDCGNDTVAAIKAIQADCGLAADGVAGGSTFANLF